MSMENEFTTPLSKSLPPVVEGVDFVDDGHTRSEQVADGSDDVGMGHILTHVVVAVDEEDARVRSSLCLPVTM